VLDRLVGGGELALPVAGLAVGGVAAAALPQLLQYLDAELSRAFTVATRQRLYAAVGRLRGLARHEDPEFQTRLSLATEVGPSGPAEVLTSSIGVLQGAAMAAGFLSALAVVNPWMLLVVLAAAAPTLRAELVLSRHRARMITQLGHAARREHFYAQLISSVEAAKEMRLYGLDGLFGARMVTELRRVDAGYRAADRRELRAQALLGGLGAMVAGGGLAWAVAAASRGELSIGDVSVFVAAVAGVQGGLSVAISGWAQAHHALLLFGHYQHIVQAEPDLAVPGAGRPVPGLRTGIEFRDVWFRYADDLPWTLRGASFTLAAGAATALVGANGAGKSTVVKLLCRFYDPTAGAILWDGVDLRELDVDGLRRRIGAVFQDFMHYELSAAENIAVGDVAALDDRERVARAAAWAGVAEAVEALPRAYDTMLTRIYMSADVGDDPVTGGRAVRRPVAAPGAGPRGLPPRRRGGRAGRAQLGARRGRRARAARAVARAAHRPHQPADLAPAQHGARRRPDRRAGRRHGRRVRDARRADGPRRPLRHPVPAPGQRLRLTRRERSCCDRQGESITTTSFSTGRVRRRGPPASR
jgi:ATP-binding cassette subfamily B protein